MQTRNEFVSDYQCVQSIGPEWRDVNTMRMTYGNVASQYKAVNLSLPESFDWRDSGIVTGVKDQVSYIQPGGDQRLGGGQKFTGEKNKTGQILLNFNWIYL